MEASVEFSNFVQFPMKCFKVFGLIPNDADNVDTIKRKVLRVYHYLVIANQIMLLCMFSIYVKLNSKDLTLLTENVSSGGFCILAVLKAFAISSRRAEFMELMDVLDGFFPRTKEAQAIARVYFTGYKRMEQVYSFLMWSAVISFMVSPIIKFFVTGIWINRLPYENWFPFEEYDPKYYNFVLLWQLHNTIITTVSLIGPDLILYSFITMIAMQFHIICIQLENQLTNESCDKLKELIKKHQRLIKLSENLEKIYSTSILFNYVGSSVLICLIGYQVSIGISAEFLIKFAILLAASLIQILLLCYYGNKLTTASQSVAEAAYSSGWWSGNNREQKIALLMMIKRSQKPCVISAQKFSVVSLQSFTNVGLKFDAAIIISELSFRS